MIRIYRRRRASLAADETLSAASTQFESILGHIADPDRYSGGATAAALVAALAAATTRLVVQVDSRRKSLREHAAELERLANDLAALEGTLISQAEEDAAALERLMAGYSTRKAEPGRYQGLLRRAAESTLDVAESIQQLFDAILVELPRANRFIISDLAAAAWMARGALGAIEATCEINLQLLQDMADESDATVTELRERFATLTRGVDQNVEQIISASRERMSSTKRSPSK